MSWRRLVIAAVLGAFALSGRPAFAGKADDTLRIAVNDWWSTLDPTNSRLDEAAAFFRGRLRNAASLMTSVRIRSCRASPKPGVRSTTRPSNSSCATT